LISLEIVFAPEISCLIDQQVEHGEDAKFTAEVTGKPKPQVEWKHGARIPAEGTKYNLRSQGNNYELLIKSCKPEDAGKVLITASNKIKSEEKKVQLHVTGKLLMES